MLGGTGDWVEGANFWLARGWFLGGWGCGFGGGREDFAAAVGAAGGGAFYGEKLSLDGDFVAPQEFAGVLFVVGEGWRGWIAGQVWHLVHSGVFARTELGQVGLPRLLSAVIVINRY